MKKTLRKEIYEYITGTYGAEPEFLWQRWPDYAVFRHSDNNKWFAVIMNVGMDKLGLTGEEKVDVINLKPGDALLADMLIREKGFLRGYHMSRGSWISVLLDGTVPMKRISALIDTSYKITASARKKQQIRPPKEWIIPANPKYYDIIRAFDERDVIEWKQGKGIRTGDTVYMYVGAPVSAVMYKCTVTETDIPYEYSDRNLTITKLMRIKLERRYPPELFTFAKLGEDYGIFAVRGPRGIPHSLSEALNI
jgi:predicted DNA-binding protein (MmcQ/YjbR family)